MADRPVLFSGPLVRAILDGRKTQTRRLGALWRKVEAGDRLWVREAWCELTEAAWHLKPSELLAGTDVRYRADRKQWHKDTRWRPSIFMPRWASRITLDVKHVRQERLQDISDADARAEGVGHRTSNPFNVNVWRESFRLLWDGINDKPGKRWRDNPEVTVVRFEVAS